MAGIQWYMGNISTRMAERGNPLAPAPAHPGREGGGGLGWSPFVTVTTPVTVREPPLRQLWTRSSS